MMFSGPEAYSKGWIRVFDGGRSGLLGFTCVRHKVRQPETSLYFIGVHPNCKHTGIGTRLLEDLKLQCPNKKIILNVMKGNNEALRFYEKHGFVQVGESLGGKGIQLTLEWDDDGKDS